MQACLLLPRQAALAALGLNVSTFPTFLTDSFLHISKLTSSSLPVAKFYKSADTFTCISNPSITLPITRLNDNYCDCPDGSDEPGTAACTHLSPLSPPQPIPGTTSGTSNTTLALPGYYCKNKGHQPAYVPFTYVNDGVCDYEICCDGSDEWEGVGGVKCEDKCKEIGKEWKKVNEARVKSAMSAQKKRNELVETAQGMRKEISAAIATLTAEIQIAEAKAALLKTEYEEVERRERGRVVKVKGKKGRTAVLAGLAKGRISELREGLESTKKRREEARAKVVALEAILSAFKEEYNPNFNDEGVKRAVKSWDDYAAQKVSTGNTGEAAEDRDIDEIIKDDPESGGINWDEWEAEEEDSDVEARKYTHLSDADRPLKERVSLSL